MNAYLLVYSVTVRTYLYCTYLLVCYVTVHTWVYGALEIVDTWGAAPTISRDKRLQNVAPRGLLSTANVRAYTYYAPVVWLRQERGGRKILYLHLHS